MIFSPKPMQSYTRIDAEGKEIGFGTGTGVIDSLSKWNLFYLSEPLADASDYWPADELNRLPQHSDMLWPCHLTCTAFPEVDEALQTLTPTEFIKYLKTTNYSAMPPYKVLGELWLERMEIRIRSPRGLLEVNGNVLSANFGGRFLNPHLNKSSSIIMTMSSTRH